MSSIFNIIKETCCFNKPQTKLMDYNLIENDNKPDINIIGIKEDLSKTRETTKDQSSYINTLPDNENSNYNKSARNNFDPILESSDLIKNKKTFNLSKCKTSLFNNSIAPIDKLSITNNSLITSFLDERKTSINNVATTKLPKILEDHLIIYDIEGDLLGTQNFNNSNNGNKLIVTKEGLKGSIRKANDSVTVFGTKCISSSKSIDTFTNSLQTSQVIDHYLNLLETKTTFKLFSITYISSSKFYIFN